MRCTAVSHSTSKLCVSAGQKRYHKQTAVDIDSIESFSDANVPDTSQSLMVQPSDELDEISSLTVEVGTIECIGVRKCIDTYVDLSQEMQDYYVIQHQPKTTVRWASERYPRYKTRQIRGDSWLYRAGPFHTAGVSVERVNLHSNRVINYYRSMRSAALECHVSVFSIKKQCDKYESYGGYSEWRYSKH